MAGARGPSDTGEPMNALLAALLLLAAAPAPVPDKAATELARKVQGYYEATRDLEAHFQQAYTYAGLGRRQLSAGTLRVKKPGMMRWDYTKPAPKTVAVKGSRLVQFEPDENQAYVDERFDASAMSAAVTFLLGKGDLVRDFALSTGEASTLLLRPKEQDPRVVDGAGNVNEIKFTEVKRNPGLPDSAFDVKLPKDVRRVDASGR